MDVLPDLYLQIYELKVGFRVFFVKKMMEQIVKTAVFGQNGRLVAEYGKIVSPERISCGR